MTRDIEGRVGGRILDGQRVTKSQAIHGSDSSGVHSVSPDLGVHR